MTVTKKKQHLIPVMSDIRIQDTKCLQALYEENPKLQVFNPDGQYDGSESLNKKIHMHLADITDVIVDAIFCSTQTDLLLEPYGLCKTVWSRGGQELTDHCRQLANCREGDAFITAGYKLPVKYIIHTAGPAPNTTLSYEERTECLKQSYLSCLEKVAEKDDIKSVAIPCLGSGGAGIQLKQAVHIGINTLREWLDTGENRTKIDHILLCMYNKAQWEEYYPKLIAVFPYGRDHAGYDIESFPRVNVQSDLSVPRDLHPSNISSIFCFKYDSFYRRMLTSHFHSMVNSCVEKVGKNPNPVRKVIRYNSCARFELGLPNHCCIIYHTQFARFTAIEIQVVNVSQEPRTLKGDICCDVKHEIVTYLDSVFDNVAAPKMCVRCVNSTWGDEDGLWEVDVLCRTSSSSACIHRRFEDTHQIKSHDLLQWWHVPGNHSTLYNQSDLPPVRREPVQHEEQSLKQQPSNIAGNIRDVDEGHWSYRSLQSSARSTEGQEGDCSPKTPLSGACSNAAHEGHWSYRSLQSSALSQEGQEGDCSPKTPLSGAYSNAAHEGHWSFTSGACSLDREDNRLSSSSVPDCSIGPSRKNRTKKKSLSSKVKDITLQASATTSVLASAVATSENNTPKNIHLADSADTSAEDAMASKTHQTHHRSESDRGPLDKKLQYHAVSKRAQSYERTRETNSPELSDKVLMEVARTIGNKQLELGIELDLGEPEVQRIRGENPANLISQGFYILKSWKQKLHDPTLKMLLTEMDACGIDTESIRKKYNIARE